MSSERPAPSGEHEAGLAVARLGRLLLVDQQPTALHQVDDEVDRLEVQQQVLAATADVSQRLAVGVVRARHGGLQRGEVERHEPGAASPGELLGEPLGVGLHLGQLGHRRLPVLGALADRRNTPSSAPNTGCDVDRASAGCR